MVNEAELAALACSELFAGVPPGRLNGLLGDASELALRTGAPLFELGQRAAFVHVVLAGRLAVHPDAEGAVPASYVGPGQCVGEHVLVDDEAPCAQVVAIEPTRLLALRPELLWSAMEREPRVALNLLRRLAANRSWSRPAGDTDDAHEARMRSVCTIDPATGLHNRRWMNDVFLRRLERCGRENHAVCLAVIDVDDFAAVNDRVGVLGAERIVAQIGRIMQRQFRPADLLVRSGAQAFCVLLPDTTVDESVAALERFRLAIETTAIPVASRTTIRVTVSAGVAPWRAGRSLEDLLRVAEGALAAAKHGGRNRVAAAT